MNIMHVIMKVMTDHMVCEKKVFAEVKEKVQKNVSQVQVIAKQQK